MNITDDGIIIEGLSHFKSFIEDLKLADSVRLSEPLLDNAGKILIKEDVAIRPTVLEKLEDLAGQYSPNFNVKIDKDLLKKIQLYLTRKITDQIEAQGNDFIKVFFSSTAHNFGSYIKNSFYLREFTLEIFRKAAEKPAYFLHMAELSLLTLGIVMQRPERLRMIHRFAFLSGLFADIGAEENDAWKVPATNVAAKKQLAQQSSALIQTISLPDSLATVIEEHIIDTDQAPTDAKENLFGGLLDADEPAPAPEEESEENTAESEKADADAAAAIDDQTIEILTETLKVSRFIHDYIRKQTTDNYIKDLVHRLAYNGSRGTFSKDLIQPITKLFNQYEESIRRIQEIAEIEKKCKFPSSAWAYPKPEATQVLCKDNVEKCPFLISGWDIHVVAAQDDYGWVGTTLGVGHYPKCKLETELGGRGGKGGSTKE